jgi:hypothetical protein
MTRQVAPGPAPAEAAPGPVPAAPYKGLQPYAEEDAAIFFGRESERRVLIANLLAARLTLVYGESGVGKSSLLRAGVVSYLREQERLGSRPRSAPRLRIVLFNEWSGDPVARLVARIDEECGCAGDQPAGDGAAGGPGRPAALADTLEAWTADRNVQVLLILDQFEEYFLYHRDEDDEGGFAAQFARAVNRRGIPVSFLVAIREDALAKLDRFKGRIPGLFENYLRVRHLRAGQATRAVTGPLERLSELDPEAEPFGADPELVPEVLDQVQVGKVVLSVAGRGTVPRTAQPGEDDPPIETPYLQMVLSRLWSEERRQGSRRLRLATLRRLGGARQIVRTHLDQAMAALAPDEQAAAAGVFRYLVTPSGSKISHTVADLADYADLEQARVRAVLAKLSAADVRITRAVAAPAGEDGEPRFEVFHDVLAPAVLDWRARWQVERRAAKEREAGRQLLEQRARRWRRRRIVGGVLVAVLSVSLLALAVQSQRQERTAVAQEAAAREVAGQATAAAQASSWRAYAARADAICVKGTAEVEALGPPPSPEGDPAAFADWLGEAVQVGFATYRDWSRLPVPPADATRAETVLNLYRNWLTLSESASLALAAGEPEIGRRQLQRARQAGRAYQRAARQSGFRDCADVVPPRPP